MTSYEITAEDIDMGIGALQDILKIGGTAYPPLAVAVPLLSAFIAYQGRMIKSGLADGTIVQDGQGGLVPKTNSRYNPKTGEFL